MAAKPTNAIVRQVDETAGARPLKPARSARGDGAGSRTLGRGLNLLDAVLEAGSDGLRVVDLCRVVALERATVHRLMGTLVERGYVMLSGRFRYVPGPRLLVHMAQSRGTPNAAIRLQPVLACVSAASGDAAFAILRDGSLSTCIARHVGSHPVQVLAIQVGTRQPVGVGAAGLALLAALSEQEYVAVVAANTPALGAYGGMTPERMHLLVRATRERGWSLIGNHATQGVMAVGMAVRDKQGKPVAAISVASTDARMPRERQQLIARWIREALASALPQGL